MPAAEELRFPSVDGIVLVGWSFGADMALSVHSDRVARWCAIAPPLHFAAGLDAVAGDPRPKHLILGEHDEIVPRSRVTERTAGWAATTIEVVPGATHFFLGASDAVVAAVLRCCADPRR